MRVCTSIKIGIHGARRFHMSKNRTPVHNAFKGKYPMHGAWQTPVHNARQGKIHMHDDRDPKKAVHLCTYFGMPPSLMPDQDYFTFYKKLGHMECSTKKRQQGQNIAKAKRNMWHYSIFTHSGVYLNELKKSYCLRTFSE